MDGWVDPRRYWEKEKRFLFTANKISVDGAGVCFGREEFYANANINC
jgi:hypothetical protein